jgi:hypothetical protein
MPSSLVIGEGELFECLIKDQLLQGLCASAGEVIRDRAPLWPGGPAHAAADSLVVLTDPNAGLANPIYAPLFMAHWCGTDRRGRDGSVRTLAGSGMALQVVAICSGRSRRCLQGFGGRASIPDWRCSFLCWVCRFWGRALSSG